MSKRVFVVNDFMGVAAMFKKFGHSVVDNLTNADLVAFTGGSDINPALYGQAQHPNTWWSPQRDAHEVAMFTLAKAKGIPMTGICRGGQLLNALCGGSMWQDVNNHGGPHICQDHFTGEIFDVTSIHHQMMIPANHAILIASSNEATYKEKMDKDGNVEHIDLTGNKDLTDPEIIYYDDPKAFCVQFHPEIGAKIDLDVRYFDYLKTYLDFGA